MHSRIYEVSKKRIPKDEHKTYDFEDLEQLGSIADYVLDSDTSRKSDINWLVRYLSDRTSLFSYEEESLIFKEGFHLDYFKKNFEELKKLVSELTLEEFSGVRDDTGYKNYQIKKLIQDDFGFYFYTEDYGMLPMDSFLRMARCDTPYYIGGIGDYHC